MKSKKSKIITIIVVAIILIIFGVIIYHYLDDLKWKKYDKEHNIDDNLLTVNCELEPGEEKIISCIIDTEEKTSNYDSFSINIQHSDSIKYLSHSIPTEEKIYESHETTTYRSEKIQDRFYVGGLEDISDLDYLINIKFKAEDRNLDNEELEFKYMTIIKDYVDHHTDDVVIKLSELTVTSKDPDTGMYKYLCLTKDLAKDAIINRNMLTTCDSEKQLPNGILTENLLKEYGLNLDANDKTYYIKTSMKDKDIINIEDIYWKLDSLTETNIKSQIGTDYLVKINDNKLYLNDTKIFDTEKVKAFYIRPYCCTGGKKILLLTEDNKVYISNEDIDLKQENITFKNLNLNNIKEFHINNYVPSMGGTHVYAIDNNNNEHLID